MRVPKRYRVQHTADVCAALIVRPVAAGAAEMNSQYRWPHAVAMHLAFGSSSHQQPLHLMARLLQKSEAARTAVKVLGRTAHGTPSVVLHASVMQSSHCSKISSHVSTKLSTGKVLCVLRSDKTRER